MRRSIRSGHCGGRRRGRRSERSRRRGRGEARREERIQSSIGLSGECANANAVLMIVGGTSKRCGHFEYVQPASASRARACGVFGSDKAMSNCRRGRWIWRGDAGRSRESAEGLGGGHRACVARGSRVSQVHDPQPRDCRGGGWVSDFFGRGLRATGGFRGDALHACTQRTISFGWVLADAQGCERADFR